MKTIPNDSPLSVNLDPQGSSGKRRDRRKTEIQDRLRRGLELHGGTPRLNGIRFPSVSVLHFLDFFSSIERNVRQRNDWTGKN
jgi:hypothetical protein